LWSLVWFHPYRVIFKLNKRSPQALRPVLTRIERRMYFESDLWLYFHMMELSHHNLNQQQTNYTNAIEYIFDAVFQIPRYVKEGRLMYHGETVKFDDEVDCLFSCPQHLPPVDFVKRYGREDPLNWLTRHEHADECSARIKLKRSCSACKGKLRDILCKPKKWYFFRFAMEYAAEHGKPRAQVNDIFIARMVYALVWRAFDLNGRRFVRKARMDSFPKMDELPPEKRTPFLENATKEFIDVAVQRYTWVKLFARNVLIEDLKRDPIRVDRRGTHSAQ